MSLNEAFFQFYLCERFINVQIQILLSHNLGKKSEIWSLVLSSDTEIVIYIALSDVYRDTYNYFQYTPLYCTVVEGFVLNLG